MGEDNAKSNVLKVRVSDDELERLNRLAEWAKMSRAETVRTLIMEAENYYISDEKKVIKKM